MAVNVIPEDVMVTAFMKHTNPGLAKAAVFRRECKTLDEAFLTPFVGEYNAKVAMVERNLDVLEQVPEPDQPCSPRPHHELGHANARHRPEVALAQSPMPPFSPGVRHMAMPAFDDNLLQSLTISELYKALRSSASYHATNLTVMAYGPDSKVYHTVLKTQRWDEV